MESLLDQTVLQWTMKGILLWQIQEIIEFRYALCIITECISVTNCLHRSGVFILWCFPKEVWNQWQRSWRAGPALRHLHDTGWTHRCGGLWKHPSLTVLILEGLYKQIKCYDFRSKGLFLLRDRRQNKL